MLPCDHAVVGGVDLVAEGDDGAVLRLGEVLDREAVQADRDGPAVVAALGRGNDLQVPARLDLAVLLDEEMVADVVPAPGEVPVAYHADIVVLRPVAGAAVQEQALDEALGFLERHLFAPSVSEPWKAIRNCRTWLCELPRRGGAGHPAPRAFLAGG
jgi:hypothetical protein